MSNDPTHSHVPQPEGQSPQRDMRAAAEQAMVERARRALEASPETIGPYRIIEKLGQGGMGEVYRAEQRVPIRRQVAIKLIKLGMDTKQVIARFEAERQALALMDHPHIAKVLDASTDDSGRPYFVMEYVKGIPINEYADKNQLTIQERLGLFGQVCHAIQHAHHKGVIHRDIKPSNVLTYTQDGKPHAKIIDFGIAKAIAQQLTDQTFYTLHSQFLGTPQYMSPEQAEGNLDIDTRTDVYSLGVMLYELLTGTTPFSIAELKAGAVDQIRKIICETEPPKPSTRLTIETATLTAIAAARRVEPTRLGALVRGELDWIVMMALDKDRRRRYDTPNDLADDIEAYLQGERVKAAPPSRVYLMQKFVRKNKGAVAIASILGTSLGVGLAGTSWQWFRADRNAQTAELSSAEAKAARQRAEDALQQAEKERALAIEQRDNAEFEAYVANLNFANGAVERGEYREAQEYLKRCPDKHRGWEWDFLNEMTRGLGQLWFKMYESAFFDSNGKAAVKRTQGGNATLYLPTALDKAISIEDIVDLPCQLHVSENESMICLSTATKLCAMDNSGALIATVPWKDLNAKGIVAISPQGSRIAIRMIDGSYTIRKVDEKFQHAVTLPIFDSPMIAGFVKSPISENEYFLVIDRNSARIFDLESESLNERTLEPSQLAFIVDKSYANLHVLGDSDRDFILRLLIGLYEAAIIAKTRNGHYCVVKNGKKQIELWSTLTRSKLAELPNGVNFDFSSDNRSLWVSDEDGKATIYELNGHVSQHIEIVETNTKFGVGAKSITSNLVFDEGELWGRDGRRIGHTPQAASFSHFVIGDRFVETGHIYNYSGVISRLEDLPIAAYRSEFPSVELENIAENDSTAAQQFVTSRQITRRVSVGKYGLRIEDLNRSRFITELTFDWPASTTHIMISNDSKRVYAVASDNSWTCYDSRTREERLEWSHRVHAERNRATNIFNELWNSDIAFDALRSGVNRSLPLEVQESVFHFLRQRELRCTTESKSIFDSKRFEYIGRKSAWYADLPSLCRESRMFTREGPLTKLIDKWPGTVSDGDSWQLQECLLRNSIPFTLKENLNAVVDAVFDGNGNRSRILRAIGKIRCIHFEEARELLEPHIPDTDERDESLQLACLRLCALARVSLYDQDLPNAVTFMNSARELHNNAVEQDYWDEESETFFIEIESMLSALPDGH